MNLFWVRILYFNLFGGYPPVIEHGNGLSSNPTMLGFINDHNDIHMYMYIYIYILISNGIIPNLI